MAAKATFIIGRAGTGKTRMIEKSILKDMEDGKKAILFVPEQFTYEAERTLSSRLGGLIGVEVLSFTRLTERILKQNERPFLSAEGRRMVLRRATYRIKGEFTAFAPVSTRPGFTEAMDELFVLSKRFGITPDDYTTSADALDEGNPLSDKLRDMSLLFRSAQDFLSERYLDTEDAVAALLSALPFSFVKDANIYVDGFDLMTKQLSMLFESLMSIASNITFSVCMDESESVFAPEERTYTMLREKAYALGLRVVESRLPSMEVDTPLLHLERYLFSKNPPVYDKNADSIRIFAAENRSIEVERAMDALQHAAKCGMRYRDITIIAGDMKAYAPLVMRACKKRGIPLFLDAGRSIESHPAIELILNAVRAAVGGFTSAPLIRLVKTGLLPISKDEAEIFENYVLERGLRGGNVFLSPFIRDDVPPMAEASREKLMPPLTALKEGLNSPDASGKTRALYAYLEEVHLGESLKKEADALFDAGRHALREEHAQVWNTIVALLDQLYILLGDSKVGKKEYLAILEEAVRAYRVGIIPATADQVLFGTLTRTKSRRVKALFVLGCNEDVLPKSRTDDGIIDDADLLALSNLGLTPWGNSRRRAENDALDIYRAFTRASESIYISYVCAGSKETLPPSYLVNNIRDMFPLRKELPRNASIGEMSEASAFDALLSSMQSGEDSARTIALRRYFSDSEAGNAILERVEKYRDFESSSPTLDAKHVNAMYGRIPRGSATRIETYNRCPFMHYVRYGLRSEVRREFRDRPARPDIGRFCHAIMQHFFEEAKGINLSDLSSEQVEARIDITIEHVRSTFEDGLLLSSPRARVALSYYEDVVRYSLKAIARNLSAGSFIPFAQEVRFGTNALFPPIRLMHDGKEVMLSGVIDRIDAAITDDATYLQIIDYKTRHQSFDLADVLAGVSIQLPLYLMAVNHALDDVTLMEKLNLQKPSAVGMYYQSLILPSEDTAKRAVDKLRLSGLVVKDSASAVEHNGGRFSSVVQSLSFGQDSTASGGAAISKRGMQKLMDIAKAKAEQTLSDIYDGNIAADPLVRKGDRISCLNCEFTSICRFETGKRKARRIDETAAKALKEMLSEEDDQ